VRIYRRCRQAGVTPRGLIDCMIAAVAWRERAAILAHDAALDHVARVVGTDLDQPSQAGEQGCKPPCRARTPLGGPALRPCGQWGDRRMHPATWNRASGIGVTRKDPTAASLPFHSWLGLGSRGQPSGQRNQDFLLIRQVSWVT